MARQYGPLPFIEYQIYLRETDIEQHRLQAFTGGQEPIRVILIPRFRKLFRVAQQVDLFMQASPFERHIVRHAILGQDRRVDNEQFIGDCEQDLHRQQQVLAMVQEPERQRDIEGPYCRRAYVVDVHLLVLNIEIENSFHELRLHDFVALCIDPQHPGRMSALGFNGKKAGVAANVEHTLAGEISRKAAAKHLPPILRMIDRFAHDAARLRSNAITQIDAVPPWIELSNGFENRGFIEHRTYYNTVPCGSIALNNSTGRDENAKCVFALCKRSLMDEASLHIKDRKVVLKLLPGDVRSDQQLEALRVRGTTALASGLYSESVALLEEGRGIGSAPVTDWYLAQAFYYENGQERAEEVLTDLRGSAQAEQRAKATVASFLAARYENLQKDCSKRCSQVHVRTITFITASA